MLRRTVLEALGVTRERRVMVRLGDGRLMERDLGIAFVRYRTYATPTWVLFGERGDASVVGALTLEELGLQVDPRSRRLREVKVALLIRAAHSPKEQREALGLEAEDRLTLRLERGELCLRPVTQKRPTLRVRRRWGREAFPSSREATFSDE